MILLLFIFILFCYAHQYNLHSMYITLSPQTAPFLPYSFQRFPKQIFAYCTVFHSIFGKDHLAKAGVMEA
jgi:hypothetical protein